MMLRLLSRDSVPLPLYLCVLKLEGEATAIVHVAPGIDTGDKCSLPQ